jgi:hypothetical protein
MPQSTRARAGPTQPVHAGVVDCPREKSLGYPGDRTRDLWPESSQANRSATLPHSSAVWAHLDNVFPGGWVGSAGPVRCP